MAEDRDVGALDIKALLDVALDERPRDDVAERVMDRVAAMDTLVELARLFGVAPLHWLRPEQGADADGSSAARAKTGVSDESERDPSAGT